MLFTCDFSRVVQIFSAAQESVNCASALPLFWHANLAHFYSFVDMNRSYTWWGAKDLVEMLLFAESAIFKDARNDSSFDQCLPLNHWFINTHLKDYRFDFHNKCHLSHLKLFDL